MWDMDTVYIYSIFKGVIIPDFKEMYLKCEDLYIALSEADVNANALKSEYDKNIDDK